jgi:integrase
MDATALRLDDYLDEWFALLRTRVQPTTWHGYHNMARAYLRPGLGAVHIGELTVRRLNLHYLRLLESGGRRGGPLSLRTVAYAHSVLHKALADGVREGVLSDNVASRATLPRFTPGAGTPTRTLRVWDGAQVEHFLQVSTADELHVLWRLALATGMRRGELLGLRWEDVDLEVPQVRVAMSLSVANGHPQLKTTKTGRARVLHLDGRTAEALRRLPHDASGFVFTRPDGGPWHPQRITDRWRRQWPVLDLPRLRLHDLRHCHATLLLDQGVPIKVVSERLGHTTIAMTMDLYAHVLPAQDRNAAAAIARALDGGSREAPGPPLRRLPESVRYARN